MESSKFYFKYDGDSESIKNHQIDAHVLATALDSISDLIKETDSILTGKESTVQIKTQAGFVQGSFGVEMIVLSDPEVLKVLGVIASGATASVFSVLKNLKGAKVDEIVIDEDSELAQIITKKGETIAAPKAVAKLINSDKIRQNIDKLAHDPLSDKGIGSFSVYSDSLDDQPIIEATKGNRAYFKKPRQTQTITTTERDTIATIEFKSANKESGKSRWTMLHLGVDEVSVKVEDEDFLAKIKRPDAPSIFGEKFKVNLTTKTSQKPGQESKKTYKIKRVIDTLRK
mgnify:CR=1 FL=1